MSKRCEFLAINESPSSFSNDVYGQTPVVFYYSRDHSQHRVNVLGNFSATMCDLVGRTSSFSIGMCDARFLKGHQWIPSDQIRPFRFSCYLGSGVVDLRTEKGSAAFLDLYGRMLFRRKEGAEKEKVDLMERGVTHVLVVSHALGNEAKLHPFSAIEPNTHGLLVVSTELGGVKTHINTVPVETCPQLPTWLKQDIWPEPFPD